jgi:hypothetical protein
MSILYRMVQNHAPGNSATGKYLNSIFALLGALLSTLLGALLCAAKPKRARQLPCACMESRGQMKVEQVTSPTYKCSSYTHRHQVGGSSSSYAYMVFLQMKRLTDVLTTPSSHLSKVKSQQRSKLVCRLSFQSIVSCLAPYRGLNVAACLSIVRGFRFASPPVMGISPPIGAFKNNFDSWLLTIDWDTSTAVKKPDKGETKSDLDSWLLTIDWDTSTTVKKPDKGETKSDSWLLTLDHWLRHIHYGKEAR